MEVPLGEFGLGLYYLCLGQVHSGEASAETLPGQIERRLRPMHRDLVVLGVDDDQQLAFLDPLVLGHVDPHHAPRDLRRDRDDPCLHPRLVRRWRNSIRNDVPDERKHRDAE